MKRLFVLFSVVVLLAGCAQDKIGNQFKEYQGMSSKQVFDKAEKALAKGSYTAATKDYEALDAMYPFGEHAKQGLLDSIYAYYKDGQPVMAIANAERFTRLYPQSPQVDYALYMQGLLQFNQNSTWLSRKLHSDPAKGNADSLKKAFASFNQLIRLYPQSRYAPDSLQRMRYIRNILARHEFYIADYYFKRHAYVAAANRAGLVVQHYSGTSSTSKALDLLVKSYRHLGLKQLAGNTYAILKRNYPDVAKRV